MSDFKIGQAQRRRLLAGNMAPLEFDTKPAHLTLDRGIEPGDMYVLAWKKASSHAYEDGFVVSTPRHPVWFITVKQVRQARRGSVLVWRVTFDATDRRDPDLWLSHSGDYQWTPRGAVDELPVVPSDEVRLKAIQERDHLARLQRHAAELRARAQHKRAKKAA